MAAEAWRPSPDEAMRMLESIRRMVRFKRRLQLLLSGLSGVMVGLLLGISAARGWLS